MKLNRRIAAVVTAALLAPLGVIVTATAASAHAAVMSAKGVCTDSGWDATFTVTNDSGNYGKADLSGTGTSLDHRYNQGASDSVTVHKSFGTNSATLPDATMVWVNDGFTQHGISATANRPQGCVETKHTTVSATFTEGSVTCVDYQAKFTQPSYTKSGDHVSWTVVGDDGFGDSIKLTAHADSGYVIDGQSVFTHTFDAKPNAPDCRKVVVPVSPKITQPECTGPGQSSEGSFTMPTDTDDINYTYAAGIGRLTAHLKNPNGDIKFGDLPDGWTLRNDSTYQADFFIVFTDPGNCLVETTPVAPTVVQSVCTGPGTSSDATITPGDTTGIVYTKDGVVVTATLVDGYKFGDLPSGWVLNDNGSASFTVDLTSAGDCLVETVPSITVTQAVCTGQGTSTGDDGYVTAGEFVTYSDYNAAQDAVVTATPAQGYKFGDLPDGWTLQENGTATFTVHYIVSSSAQCVVATAPSATPPTCENDGALVIPTQDGVVYGQYPQGTGPGTYKVWAHAAQGFILTGKHYWKITVLPRDRSLCTAVTPVTPVPTDATCADGQTLPLPSTEGITYAVVNTAPWLPGGNLVIQATATSGNHFTEASLAGSGYTLQGEGDTVATLPYPSLAPHLDCVSAVTPGIDQGQCTNGVASSATVTLVAAEGISYSVNGGIAVRGGTYKVSTGDVNVVATADEGKTLVGTSTWTVKAKSVTCIITQIITHKTALPFTGINLANYLWAALALFSAGGVLLLAATRRRRDSGNGNGNILPLI